MIVSAPKSLPPLCQTTEVLFFRSDNVDIVGTTVATTAILEQFSVTTNSSVTSIQLVCLLTSTLQKSYVSSVFFLSWTKNFPVDIYSYIFFYLHPPFSKDFALFSLFLYSYTIIIYVLSLLLQFIHLFPMFYNVGLIVLTL